MKMRQITLLICFIVTILFMVSFTVPDREDGIYPANYALMVSDTSNASLWIKVDSFGLNIIPPSSGVQFYKDGIIFLSSSKEEGKMLPGQLSFGKIDTRYSVITNSGLGNSQAFSQTSSFPYPTEAITFSKDNNTMYFTRYNPADGTEKIYKATLNSGSSGAGDWNIESDPLSFCTGQSVYTHPTLSTDGKLLIFASNRTGSIGGMDLFASLEKDGKWSDPVNLGDAVNSTANELYPYLDSDKNLFFSSDNLQGFGGYDVYVCKYKSNTWEKPINLSTPVNTRFDDVAFKINRNDGKSAFYTVKQNEGRRAMQLCKVTMTNDRPDTLLTLSQYFTRPDISQMVILALEPAVQATDAETEAARTRASESEGGNETMIYRVQFMTSFNPRTRSDITVSGRDYNVYEYLYSGAYRLCVGEFSTISPALELQNILMKNGYPQAFVVLIKNNVLSLDPELLTNQEDSEPAMAEQPVISKPETITTKPAEQPAKVTEKTVVPETTKTEPVATKITEPQPNISEPPKQPVKQQPVKVENEVIYRVQILTNKTAKGSYALTINNKSYNTFEYFYVGAYRTCVGEFSTLDAAKELQSSCRKSGYSQAFVVAFVNGKRSTDAALFK